MYDNTNNIEISNYMNIEKSIDKSHIRFFVMDVDGTLTDGKIYMSDYGELFKAFDIKDGCGIHDILPKYGIIPVIITARKSKILTNRCKELNITRIYQSCSDKLSKLREVTDGELSTVAYIGDDILDLQCIEPVKEAGGIVGCPADAVEAVRNIADFVSSRNGGNGAVRDFIEWLTNRMPVNMDNL